MTFSKSTAVFITVAALSPAISNASPERASVKACAAAFAASLTAPGTKVPGYKLDYHPTFESSLADFYPSEFTFTLEARDPKSGLAIARASCTADTRGAVTEIAAIPLDRRLAAR
jgi:hypothetical protein